MADTPSSPWLTVRQAAARAQVNPRLIYASAGKGLRAARVAGRRALRFRAEWIDLWLDSTAEPVEIASTKPR